MPTQTFNYTGAMQTWVVPTGVFSVTIEAWGAEGGRAVASGSKGRGGYTKGNLAVTPGETLRIYVGQRPSGRTGGWNGGAAGGGENSSTPPGFGGGGASDVRQGGTALSNRKIVAAGGGGAGVRVKNSAYYSFVPDNATYGGQGGANTGQRGELFDFSTQDNYWQDGGRGGTQTAGGAANFAGAAGSLAVGGAGGTGSVIGGGGDTGSGGGGGGGLYGGGGGTSFEGHGAAGGGGSNYIGGVTSTTTTRGVRAGNGQVSFEWNVTDPSSPTSVSPTSGATVSTDLPTLSANMPVHPAGSSVTQKVEWQLATNSGFSTELRTVTQPGSALKSSGSQSMQVPAGDSLFQGTWHIRARIIDQYGGAGDWSASHSFTVSHPPSTTGHSPTGNPFLQFGNGQRTFSWTFTDPSPVDFQTAFEVEVQRTDGTAVVSSGEVVSGNQSSTLSIGASHKDENLRWRVRVRDRDSVWGSWSSWNLFSVGDPGTVQVDLPSGSVETPNPLVEWTPTFGGNRVQTHYQVRFKDDGGFVIHDTGWVSSSSHSHQVTSPILDNGEEYSAEVRVRGSGGLETDWDSSGAFSVAFVDSESPLFTVTDLYQTDGYVRIWWDDSRHDEDFFYYRVWRRRVVGGEPGDWELLIERNDQPGEYEYRDWLAASGGTYEYAVTQAANRFGDIVESERFPEGASPVSDHYWLVHPLDESLTMRVDRVVDENFEEEYEQESMHVLGRGRHVDYGDRLGFAGSLTAQFRDYENGLSAREQRMKLQGIKASLHAVYLRNPFGDVWQVAVGDLAIGRVSGVGRREFFDVTIPYEEVL